MTKNELYKVRKIGIEIKAKRLEAAFLRDLAGRATATMTAVKVSGTRERSRVEDAVVKLVDIEDEIALRIEALTGERQRAAREIEKLKSQNERVIMQLRYLACMKWEEIAEEMGYGVQHIFKLHGEALEKLRVNAMECE